VLTGCRHLVLTLTHRRKASRSAASSSRWSFSLAMVSRRSVEPPHSPAWHPSPSAPPQNTMLLRARLTAVCSRRRAFHATRPRAAAGSPTEVWATEDRQEGLAFATTLRTGRHTLRSDLMPAASGADVGPSPKELVMLALASCTVMTCRTFAANSLFPLEQVAVRVRETVVPPEQHVPERLEVEITLTGPLLTTAQRERLLRASARCPVKRMLHGDMPGGIVSTLTDPPGA
jgi:uncharacterized OsmC-like protein